MKATQDCQHPGGCPRPGVKQGWCKGHYARVYRRGDPGPVELAPLRNPKPARTCEIPDCSAPHVSGGFCARHYWRWRKHGDPLCVTEAVEGCAIADCDRPHKAKGYCATHYRRLLLRGDPLVTLPPGAPAGEGHHLRVEAPGYTSAHYRVKHLRGPAQDHACEHCSAQAANWAYVHDSDRELVDERGRAYSPDPDDYIPLCLRCHSRFDDAYRRSG